MDCPHCGNADIISVDTLTEKELVCVQAALLTMQEININRDVVDNSMKAALTRALKKIRRWIDIKSKEE